MNPTWDPSLKNILLLGNAFYKSYSQGAQTVLHCATESSLSEESGHLYRDCKLYVSKKDLDPEVALRLWEVSAKLTGIKEIVK